MATKPTEPHKPVTPEQLVSIVHWLRIHGMKESHAILIFNALKSYEASWMEQVLKREMIDQIIHEFGDH